MMQLAWNLENLPSVYNGMHLKHCCLCTIRVTAKARWQNTTLILKRKLIKLFENERSGCCAGLSEVHRGDQRCMKGSL